MSIRDQIEGFVEETQEYVEARVEHAQLQTVEKATSAVSTILSWICIAAVAFICMMLVTVLAVFLLHMAVGSYLQSIAIVLGFYLITITIMIVFRKRILNDVIKNKLLGVYLNMEDE